jgi:hypothetical protein
MVRAGRLANVVRSACFGPRTAGESHRTHTGRTVRRLLGSRWVRAFVIWTALIAVLIVPLWPAASAPFPPCAYQGAANQDTGLPPCPPDNANYEAIGVFLLILLWSSGIVILLLAFALARVARWHGDRRGAG